MKRKEAVKRKEARECLSQLRLACELVKLIRRFFPDLLPRLGAVSDPRHPSYITYKGHVLLMTRILSSIFYISSMRKTSEEFNSDTVISNIGYICKEELTELPYWETINEYLKRLKSDELQGIICQLVRRLIRSRAFENARIRGKYWQVIIDGTQLVSSRKKLDGECLYRIHKKGTKEEYTEYYYYVLEAKLYLHKDIYVSIMTEFVENREEEMEKQDCELKACYRLMERLKKEFPMLRICISGDSLYACQGIFKECRKKNWKYLIRFKKGRIPVIYEEYETIRALEKNYHEKGKEGDRSWEDYVNGIEYEGDKVNVVEYGEEKGMEKKRFIYITNLPVKRKRVKEVIESGRRRWGIENQGFNTQKRQGYHLEHRYSHSYQGMKNHYLLIQIGHMISQVMEGVEKLWKEIRQSREQKHKRMLESWKGIRVEEYIEIEEMERTQYRFA